MLSLWIVELITDRWIKDLIEKELQPFTYKVNFTGGEWVLQIGNTIADFIKNIQT
jgi:hypothetical protein